MKSSVGSEKSAIWGDGFCRDLGNGRRKVGGRVLRPGLAFSVLTTTTTTTTTDLNNETLIFPTPLFRKETADPKNVASIILGGGAGTQLFPLTSTRATPAVPIGGCYRLIDIPMSNCINSGINKIFIMTQFNSASLNRHIYRTYNLGNGVNFGNGFVEVLAATQTPGEAGMNWFQGTADAVRQFTWVFEDGKNKNIEHVLILSGDHLYRMNYMDFVQKHIDTGADITVSCVPVDDSRASDYGLMKIDKVGRIVQFSEKPMGDDLESMKIDTTILRLSRQEALRYPYIASMDGSIQNRMTLGQKSFLQLCRSTMSRHIYLMIIGRTLEKLKHSLMQIYHSSVSYYYDGFVLRNPKFEFYDSDTPFFTSPRFLPPSKVERCRILDAIISHGCLLRECSVQHSIVGVRSRLNHGVELKDTMMMGADCYETEAEIASLLADGKVPFGVGKNTKISNCIIDMNARIGRNVIIANKDGVQKADRPSEGFYIRSGLTIVPKNSTIKDVTII